MSLSLGCRVGYAEEIGQQKLESRGRMFSKLSAFPNQKWFQVTLLTVAGTLAFIAISWAVQALFAGDANAGRPGLLSGYVLPLLFIAPLLALLGVKLHENALLKQKYAQELAHDSLTSCLNGTLFSAAIDVFATGTGRRKGALLMVDIDHLKRINEHIGYSAGNQAISVIAGIIRSTVRSGDLVGRIGGDEFGVYLPGASKENAEKVAERIRHAVSEVLFEPSGSNWPLTVSVGAVLFETEATADDLLVAAEHQIQIAKEKGRNRIESTRLSDGRWPSRPSLH
ncbi:GGDEF domain-containing protein [Aminobacter aganoensis]